MSGVRVRSKGEGEDGCEGRGRASIGREKGRQD